MNGYVTAGREVSFELHKALLIYKRKSHRGDEAFVTQHDVKKSGTGESFLGPGEVISIEFVRSLMRSLQGETGSELLPENVLVHTYDRIVWWVPPAIRTMFYLTEQMPELQQLSGKAYPQPALLLDAHSGGLRIRALNEVKRPNAKTKLYRAPYWNVDDRGGVCLGDTRTPENTSVTTLKQWETSFFESAFTHQNSQQKLTTHPNGFVGLWGELKGKKTFPVRYLAAAGQTLEQYLER
jgi:PRTRC genetic system protein B